MYDEDRDGDDDHDDDDDNQDQDEDDHDDERSNLYIRLYTYIYEVRTGLHGEPLCAWVRNASLLLKELLEPATCSPRMGREDSFWEFYGIRSSFANFCIFHSFRHPTWFSH